MEDSTLTRIRDAELNMSSSYSNPTNSDAWAQPGQSVAPVEELQLRLARRLATSPRWHDKITGCLGTQKTAIQVAQTLTEEWVVHFRNFRPAYSVCHRWIVGQVVEAWEWKDEVCSTLYIRHVSADCVGRTRQSRSKLQRFESHPIH